MPATHIACGRVHSLALVNGVPCPRDLNGSSTVDATDLTALLSAWGQPATSNADINGDGIVGPTDLTALLAAWGPCPS